MNFTRIILFFPPNIGSPTYIALILKRLLEDNEVLINLAIDFSITFDFAYIGGVEPFQIKQNIAILYSSQRIFKISKD